MSRMTTILRISCFALLILFMAAPVLARLGIEAGPGMEIYGIKGKRLPLGLVCDWKDSGLVVGYGESCCIEVTANDVDMYYDPIPVPGDPLGVWTVYGPDGQPVPNVENLMIGCVMHNDPSGTWYFTTDLIFLPTSPGTYTAECLIVDNASEGNPAHDPDVGPISMTFEVKAEAHITRIFTTDMSNISEGSVVAGVVGVDVESIGGMPAGVYATHACICADLPQMTDAWERVSSEETCEFPNKYRFIWNTKSAAYHNGDWQITAGVGGLAESQDHANITVRNLTVESSPDYILQGTSGGGGTITYTLDDAFEVFPAAQSTDVIVSIRRADGACCLSESFTVVAGNGATFSWDWDGKDGNGDAAPPGPYVVSVSATQIAPNPPIFHPEMEYDKTQLFSLTSCTPVVTATDPDTGASTVHVTTSAIGPGTSAELDSVRLQVFDPEGSQVAGTEASGYLPADGSTLDFPDVSITFDKAGDYVFMVSADAKVCNGTANIDKAHRIMPINPVGTKIVAVKPATITGPEGPLCPGESGTYTATTEPAGHESMLRWSGGDEPATAEGAEYTTLWYTSGTKTVKAECAGSGGFMPVADSALTKQVTVEDPDRQVTFLEPTGTIGGKVAVRMSVSTKCATSNAPELEEKEETTLHETNWQPLGPGDLESQVTEDGITTSVFKWIWNTTPVHNGTHRLHATTTFNSAPGHTDQEETEQCVSVLNLAITSTNPEGVVAWKGEGSPAVPVTINVEDNDTSDPMDFHIAFYSTAQDNRGGWTPTRVMDAYGITGGSYTFNWDGTDDGGMYAAPGTYTYEVEVDQTDVNPPDLVVDDSCTYRSPFLHIIRASDEDGSALYDADYYSCDDNGTPEDDSDDDYIYLVRRYVLSGDKNAKAGELWLFDPLGNKICTWDVGSLQCLDHGLCDGLSATGAGVRHSLSVRIPASTFNTEGDYRLVLHLEDDHAPDYRDHRERWALDLNYRWRIRTFHIEDDWMVKPDGTTFNPAARSTRLKQAFKKAGWIVRTAPDTQVDAAYCGALPTSDYTEHLADSMLDEFSRLRFHYYDHRDGGLFGHPNPYRYVHVIGIDGYEYDHDESDGSNTYGLTLQPERWCYVFVGHLAEGSGSYLPEHKLLVTMHEVGHQLGLPEHRSDEDWDQFRTDRGLYCVMLQGEPSGLMDFAYCRKCINTMNRYHGYGW